MRHDPLPAPVAAWLQFARDDLFIAELAAATPGAPGWPIAFHCQQAVEKAFKGYLALRGQPVPYSHDLAFLVDLLSELGQREPVADAALQALTPFAISEKYPVLLGRRIEREAAIVHLVTARSAIAWLERCVSAAP